MAFKRKPQKFPAAINQVAIGTGDNAVVMGGENVMPFYTFDAPIEHKPLVGIQVSDAGFAEDLPKMAKFYAGTTSLVERVQRAAAADADFVSIYLESADPNNADRAIDEVVADVKAVADAVDAPFAIEGCGNIEKDQALFEKIAEALQGKNILVLSAREENYKGVAASAGLAYGQKVGAESSVDINLAKQLNVIIGQLGVNAEAIVMNLGTAAAGYGFEYLVSTIDRVKAAALGQGDVQLQMPIITPVANDAWGVKEAIVSEADFPEWGPTEERGIQMEICTASSCLAAGSDAVILRHPESVATISAFINELV